MKFALKVLAMLALTLSLINTIVPAEAAKQVFAQQYSFDSRGELKQPLTMFFKANMPIQIKAVVSPLDEMHNLLLVAFPEGTSVFAINIAKGYEYALYKLELREKGSQELLILSYGKRGTGRTALKGIDIIGSNDMGTIVSLPVVGFKEVTLFNSPLQVRPNRSLILFRDKMQSVVNIIWNNDRKQFDVSGVE